MNARPFAGALLTAAFLCSAQPCAADEKKGSPPAPGTSTVTVKAGDYEAGPFHRLFLGRHYRDVWTAPIEVRVLDLSSYAGGLTPKKKGGGKQTKSLSLDGGDGREFKFRSVDKDPSPTLPKELEDTVADWVVQDQISAAHPTAPLVVDALSDAVGIWHPRRELYVMPDDPRLGEFRKEFAGMLGFLEEDPDKGKGGFKAAQKIIDSADLMKLLDADPQERVDTRALLKARLFDDFVGDWDRHWDQWDWARVDGNPRWVPIPKDRDQAFAKFDGLVLKAARMTQPRFVNFERSYPSMVGLNFHAQFLDRRVLVDLPKETWIEVARELQAGLTDKAIADALRLLPPPHYAESAPKLDQRLRRRRDALPEAALDFYRLLAHQVAIQGTARPERVEIVHEGKGDVTITIAEIQPDGTPAGPYYRRRFSPEDTREVRVYLAAGDDRAVSSGERDNAIKVRIVGGTGADVLDDRGSGGAELFETGPESQILTGRGTSDSFKEYVHPKDGLGNPMRDWGGQTVYMPLLGAGPDLGFLGGLQMQRTNFGFRKHPFASQHTVSAAYSTARQGFRVDVNTVRLRTNSRRRTLLFARASDIEVVRFYGFGNDTQSIDDEDFYRVAQRQFVLTPALSFPLARNFDFVFGPTVKFATLRDEDNFVSRTRPYGSGDFGQAGFTAGLHLERRNHPRNATKGASMRLEGAFYPELWDVAQDFGNVQGELTTYLTVPMIFRPTLALRAGGKRVFGDYPFHESAFIGGPDSVRGLQMGRYAGDASAFGNAELRLRLFQFRFLVPTHVGVFGLTDAGRVFLGGEDSDRWHTGVGGGLFLTFYRPENTFSIAAAQSEGRTRLYVRGGLSF